MAASRYPHGSIWISLEHLTGAHSDVWEPYWGSVGEVRPYERYVSHYDSLFLLAPVGSGQRLKDFEALPGCSFRILMCWWEFRWE